MEILKLVGYSLFIISNILFWIGFIMYLTNRIKKQ
jgi:hypothetical protein